MTRTPDTHLKPSEPEALKDGDLDGAQGGTSSLVAGRTTDPRTTTLEMNSWLEAAQAGQMDQSSLRITTGKATGKRVHKP